MSRPSLTPHQRRVWKDLQRWSNHTTDHWVHLSLLGARGALDHLVDKGYAEVDVYSGPRGGEHRRYRPAVRADQRMTASDHRETST